MTSSSIPSRSCSAGCPSSSWCCSCRPGQPAVPQVQRDHRADRGVLRPQHRPARLAHELTLERLEPLCLDRRTAGPVCVPEAGGRVLLLLLQAHSRAAGRPPLLPGLGVAAQGVHAGPKVTCHWWCLSGLRPHVLCEGPGRSPQARASCVQPPGSKILPRRFQIPVPSSDSRTCLVPLALGSAPLLPAPGALAGSAGGNSQHRCSLLHTQDQAIPRGMFCAADWARLGHEIWCPRPFLLLRSINRK